MDFFSTVAGQEAIEKIAEGVGRIADAMDGAGSPLDPKGNVVLETGLAGYGETLLFLPKDKCSPFVLAHGYDAATGEWASGDYCASIAQVAAKFTPKGEVMVVREDREDVADALQACGAKPTDENIDELLDTIPDSAWDCACERMEQAFEDVLVEQIIALLEEGALEPEDGEAQG